VVTRPRLGVFSVVVVVSLLTALTHPGGAAAFAGGPGSPITDPANVQKVKYVLRDITTSTSTIDNYTTAPPGYTITDVRTGIYQARGAAGIWPKLGAATIAVGTAYTVHKIVEDTVGAYIYLKIAGVPYGSTPPPGTTEWRPMCPESYCALTSISVTGMPTLNKGAVLRNTTSGYAYCVPYNVTGCTVVNSQAWTAEAQAQGGTEVVSEGTGTGCGAAVAAGACRMKVRSIDSLLEAAGGVQAASASDYAGAAYKFDGSTFTQPQTTTDDQVQAALKNLGANDSEAGSDAQEAAIEAIEEQIGETPSSGETQTVALPQPMIEETAVQYRTRLRSLGFLGTVNIVDEVSALPEFGPDVVTKLEATTPSGTTGVIDLLDPWPYDGYPFPLDLPGSDSEIEITKNPSGSDPANGDPVPGAIPPGIPPIDIGNCSCPAPDFSPLTGMDYGEKFPFGVITMVSDFLGDTLLASPDAPVFSFDFAGTDTPVGTYDLGGGDVDLEVVDDYVATVRTILTLVIWVGGLWWFGSRWFGFRGGGDPGAAVDEAYD